MISLLSLALIGRLPEDSAGWVTAAPIIYASQATVRPSRRARLAWATPDWSALEQYAWLTSPRLFCQLALLLALGGPSRASPLLLLPVLRWGLELVGLRWPGLTLQPSYQALRSALWRLHLGALLVLGWTLVSSEPAHLAESSGWGLGLGLLTSQATNQADESGSGPKASGRLLEGGIYEVRLSGDFVIRYQPVDEFDRRMFLLSLRRIRLPDGPPKQPYLRQEWLAAWFGTHQELISRWESYQRKADWRRLMSRLPGPPFSLDEQRPILQLWARNFWLTPDVVVRELAAQGIKVTLSGVEMVAKQSGFWWVRQMLLERFGSGPLGLETKDGWLVARLFRLVAELIDKLEAGQPLSVEERLDIAALRGQGGVLVGSEPGVDGLWQGTARRALPPIYALQRALFGCWEDVGESTHSVHCPYCHSAQVARKSRQGRPKRFYDAQGQVWVIEVNRYYCRNKACSHGSFTDLPPGLLPYSRWSETWRWLALEKYVWARGTYRLVARQLGIPGATAYRWVRQFGQELLPMAALFGLVRSSGVVGIDEKWVKVPKNDKPEGKHRQWMYVHFAVDVYTYDLLHIAIFPDENSQSAQAFLLEFKTKGYRPSVIVTDLRKDYGPIIAAVFPKAEHHECVFHALQAWSDQLRDAYGSKYREKVPEAKMLAEALEEIFQAKTKRTARERYDQVLGLRQQYVGQTPKVACVFDSLERHFPKLLSAVESERIPLTNNAVELVIRRFEQHYRGFCGFESIETAQSYLAVFELVYRLSPFSPDARPGIRGKCPLELAGYDVSKLPITQAWRGFPPLQSARQPGRKEPVPSA
jgi:transposase-like protein